jgi:hypothetical protein
MRQKKKNMKFKNKKKNYYKRYSNNRAYINRRLPLLAKAGMIANRSSPTRVREGLPVGMLSSLMGSSSVPEGTLLTTSDYEDPLPLTYDPKLFSSYNAWRAAVEDYHRSPQYQAGDKGFEVGFEAGWHEAMHPWEMVRGPFPVVGTRSPTRAEKKKIEHLTSGYKPFLVQRNNQTANVREAKAAATLRAYKNARDQTRRSNIKTGLLSLALGAAAAHGAHLYMGANQPQPPQLPQLPQPTQSYMPLTSRMQQSLADLTRGARGKKRTRRRHKNRK